MFFLNWAYKGRAKFRSNVHANERMWQIYCRNIDTVGFQSNRGRIKVNLKKYSLPCCTKGFDA